MVNAKNTRHSFDQLAVALARPLNRRSALKAFGLGLGALALGRNNVNFARAADSDYVVDPTTPASTDNGVCAGINDYPLLMPPDVSELATSGKFIHVQFWDKDNSTTDLGNAEWECVLDASAVPGGRFIFTETALDMDLHGHVWELDGCDNAGAIADMEASIQRRIDGNVNTKGKASKDWCEKLFTPAVGGNTSGSGTDETDAETAMQGCPPSDAKTYKTNTDVTIKGPAIVQPWWNTGKPSFKDEQVRVMLVKGTEATFAKMQGASYAYADNDACIHNLPLEFANGADLRSVHLADLVKEGLVTVKSTGKGQDDYKVEAAKK